MENSIKINLFSRLLGIFEKKPQIFCVTPEKKKNNIMLANDGDYNEDNDNRVCDPCYPCSPKLDDLCMPCNPCMPVMDKMCMPCNPCMPITEQLPPEER